MMVIVSGQGSDGQGQTAARTQRWLAELVRMLSLMKMMGSAISGPAWTKMLLLCDACLQAEPCHFLSFTLEFQNFLANKCGSLVFCCLQVPRRVPCYQGCQRIEHGFARERARRAGWGSWRPSFWPCGARRRRHGAKSAHGAAATVPGARRSLACSCWPDGRRHAVHIMHIMCTSPPQEFELPEHPDITAKETLLLVRTQRRSVPQR